MLMPPGPSLDFDMHDAHALLQRSQEADRAAGKALGADEHRRLWSEAIRLRAELADRFPTVGRPAVDPLPQGYAWR